MAYKILAQTSATAASASTVLNLIKDPSFEGITRGPSQVLSTNGSTWESIGGTQWWVNCTDTNYYLYFTAGNAINVNASSDQTRLATNAAYDSTSLAIGTTSNTGTQANLYVAYGLAITGYSGGTNATSAFRSSQYAMPVTAGTTYYFGVDMTSGNDIAGGATINVLFFNSSGTYLSGSLGNSLTANTTSAFTRNNFSVVAPTNAVYAGIYIAFNSININGNSIKAKIDGVYFGPDSSYATAYKNPNTPTSLLLTSGYTSRLSASWSGTVNNSTTVAAAAGAPTLLYTVPSSKSTVVSTITAANCDFNNTTYRIAVVPAADTLSNRHWVVFDAALQAYQTSTVTIGMTLATGDKIYVASDAGTTQFTAFGNEA